MSVYRDTDQTEVTFKHPISAALTAVVTDPAGVEVDRKTEITSSAGVFTYLVPWQLTQYDRTLTITWSDGGDFSRQQTFNVVTPLVSIEDLRTLYTDESPFDAEIAELETTVRTVVESYTGQKFGFWNETDTYVGNGTGKLIFNKRAIKVNGVLGGYAMYESNWIAPGGLTNEIGQLNIDKVGLIQDGWAAVFNWPEYLDVRQAPPMELIQFAPAQDGTIRVPRRVMRERDKGAHYLINAEWGYYEVPEDVRQAALLLANSYIAGDSEYRDRYLSILKIQQDSFTYHPGAFRGTGNARADLLLGPYRRQNGMVIL